MIFPIIIGAIFYVGDGYVLGTDIEKGIKNLTLKYGKICGFWLGPHRAVVVADFGILQQLLNRPETTDRDGWPPEVVGNKCPLNNHKCSFSHGRSYLSKK